jgi:IS1 family transposase
MNKLSTEMRARVLMSLVEGNSINSTCRMTGVAQMTVLSLIENVGEACAHLHDTWIRDIKARRIQVDEIWSFVGYKAKNVPVEKRGLFGYGDVWTFVAIDAESKLIVSWRVGRRDDVTTDEFMMDLAGRLANRVQLTSDGYRTYPTAVEAAFHRGANVDYGILVKNYSEAPKEERRRYSPSKFVSAQLTPIFGKPDVQHISTSYVERQNLTVRMSSRRMTRLTNAFSKKVENHTHQHAINFAYYNFCRIHKTLRATPAMAAGIVSEAWKVRDLVKYTEEREIMSTWPLAQAS